MCPWNLLRQDNVPDSSYWTARRESTYLGANNSEFSMYSCWEPRRMLLSGWLDPVLSAWQVSWTTSRSFSYFFLWISCHVSWCFCSPSSFSHASVILLQSLQEIPNTDSLLSDTLCKRAKFALFCVFITSLLADIKLELLSKPVRPLFMPWQKY